MPLVVVAAASAVAPPPPRRVAPFLSLRTPRAGTLALTVARCSPSPSPPAAAEAPAPPQEAKRKPQRYPKQYPGQAVGVAEEMRFVAMRLRNRKRTTIKDEPGAEDADAGADADASASEDDDNDGDDGGVKEEHEKEEDGELVEGEWMPSMEGFVLYLVDSKLVFDTIERVVAESTDVAYVYFRKSGLERSASISKDLEWFREQGVEIPEPSTLGSTYATYLTELAESNAPAFLSHYYNIYFAHVTGGVAIGNKLEAWCIGATPTGLCSGLLPGEPRPSAISRAWQLAAPGRGVGSQHPGTMWMDGLVQAAAPNTSGSRGSGVHRQSSSTRLQGRSLTHMRHA